MATHDYSIANQSFPNTRTDINNVLSAIQSLNSINGIGTLSTGTVAGMLVYDTADGWINQRNAADSAWIKKWKIGGSTLLSSAFTEVWGGASAAGTDAYAVTLTPTITAYSDGMVVGFEADVSNTGSCTLNVDSVGAVEILKNGTQSLQTGDIIAGQYVWVVYDNTASKWQAISQLGNNYTINNMTAGSALALTDKMPYADASASGINKSMTVQDFFQDLEAILPVITTLQDADLIPVFDDSNSENLSLITKANLTTAVGGSLAPDFTSSASTITSGGLLTLAHGLGASPNLITLTLKCTTTDGGWAVNDEWLWGIATGANKGACIYWDSTNIYVRFANEASVFIGFNKTTGTAFSLTNGNWNVIIKAWL